MVIRYRGTPPSLAVAKVSAHTRYWVFLWWWWWWSCWWCKLFVHLPRHRFTIIEGWSSLWDPQICNQTHPLESIFVLTVLVLQVIDLGLEVLDFLVKLEDGLPNVLGVQLVVVGELRDHHLVGIESAFHHPLALKNLLFHCFELYLHASGTPWSLHIADVQHPITHLNGLRVMQHLHDVGVDDPLGKPVLGGAWRRHGALDLSEKQLETKTEDICVIRWSKPWEII